MTHSKHAFNNIYVFVTHLSSFAENGNCLHLALSHSNRLLSIDRIPSKISTVIKNRKCLALPHRLTENIHEQLSEYF